jgi:hypothetical protein
MASSPKALPLPSRPSTFPSFKKAGVERLGENLPTKNIFKILHTTKFSNEGKGGRFKGYAKSKVVKEKSHENSKLSNLQRIKYKF